MNSSLLKTLVSRLSELPRPKLNATLLGTVMVSLLWCGVIGKHIENRASDFDGYKRDASNVALLFEENVLRSIGEIDKAILYLRRVIEKSSRPRDYHSIVSTADVISELIVQVAVIDANGIMRASNAGPQPAPPVDLSDREHFKFHVTNAGDSLFISRPVVGRASGRWSVQLTRRLSKPDGSFDGVVVCSFNPDHFARFYGKIDLGHGASFGLVGLDGIVRAASSNGGSIFALAQDLSATQLLAPIRDGHNSGFVQLPAIQNGHPMVLVRRVSGQQLAVAVALPETAIFEQSLESLKLFVSAAALLSLLIAAATWQARKSEQEVKLKARQLQLTLEHMSQGIMMVTSDLTIPIMNRKCAELLDLPLDFVSNPPTFDSLTQFQMDSGEFASVVMPNNLTALDVFGPADKEGRFDMYERTRPNGTVLEVRSARLDDGSFVRTFSDVTNRKNAQSEANRLASQDVLTGLANRRVLKDALDRLATPDADGGAKTYAILCIDLDRFKLVNDTQGHAVGDLLLKAVAARMRQSLRSTDLIARIGGDEFAVLMAPVDGDPIPEIVAARLVETLSRPYEIEGHQLLIGASIGIAVASDDASTTDDILIAADLALYAAKAAGRGTYRFFRKEMNDDIRARQRIETDLRIALQTNQLELHYQPIIELGDRSIVGFEALARWRHPVDGMIPPDKFIPVAEDCGLIGMLGQWALRQACQDARHWPEHVRVAVNLSPLQFASPNLPDVVEAALADAGIDASRLELEITEGLLMQNTERTLGMLHRLKDQGVRIAMDDFGTGYSSLSHMQSFPFDKIKIDRCFVQGANSAPHAATVVRSVIDIAVALGMTTTAEGVETEEQCQALVELGCGEAQGYLFGRPLPVAEANRLMGVEAAVDRHAA